MWEGVFQPWRRLWSLDHESDNYWCTAVLLLSMATCVGRKKKTNRDEYHPPSCSATFPPPSGRQAFRAATSNGRDVTNAPQTPLHANTSTARQTQANSNSNRGKPFLMNGESSPGAKISSPVFGGEKAATEVVVVGAGVGGLATAARLAKAGCRCVE